MFVYESWLFKKKLFHCIKNLNSLSDILSAKGGIRL